MIINEAGEYTLQYTATDACGNSTTVERDLVVEAPPRTVLYTDGTLIINELPEDIDDNVALHGVATNVYEPFDPNGDTDVKKYIFSSESLRPWYSEVNSVSAVEIGSNISPTSTQYWFMNMRQCVSMDLSKLDTSEVTDMSNMFYYCQRFANPDFSNFDTSKVTNMNSMFYYCEAFTTLDLSNFDTHLVDNMRYMFYESSVTEVDLSSFDTSSVTDMESMFGWCNTLVTIYASLLFDTTLVTSSMGMFTKCTSLVGGAGTAWSSSSTDKTRAKIDGGSGNPGYFTAKS